MATIYIENEPYEVDGEKNLLEVILSLGMNLPYFCWHPAMGSVGACRQCAVKQFKDENDTRGKIVMACMTPAADGTRISIDDPDVKSFRKSVIEWMMTNHPHDCPVCDEGGECHLQDMTVMTGHNYRRFRFPKRTFKNQYLGPFVNHEMNRCIQCYRCVRFYRDYAGGRDFAVFGIHNGVYFGRYEDGILENEFSGNLVEICPTGVFTDKTLKRHYTRKWDLQSAPSVCVHCGLGCNTLADERYGRLCRIRNRFNGDVNGYYLCDRGRYGYEFVNGDKRVRSVFVRNAGLQSVPKSTALEMVVGLLSQGGRVIGVGSPRASLEANFALKTLVGPEHFYRGESAQEDRLADLALQLMRQGRAKTPTLGDIAAADAILVLGEDITNTAPIAALGIRQWLRLRRTPDEERLKLPRWNDAAVGMLAGQTPSPLYMVNAYPTKLDDVASVSMKAAPGDVARLGYAVADAIVAQERAKDVPEPLRAAVGAIALALGAAKNPIVITGTSHGEDAIMLAAAKIAEALIDLGACAKAAYIVPECNTVGLHLLGGKTFEQALADIEEASPDVAIVLENDLYQRVERERAEQFIRGCRNVVVLDHVMHETAENASAVFPCGTFAESDGTFVNLEGRAQRFYRAYVPEGDIQDSWRWIRDIMSGLGREEGRLWQGLDDLTASMCAAVPDLERVAEAAPPASFRINEMKVARQPRRYSGRTAMNADVDASEPRPPDDPDSPLTFSMEGYQGTPPSPLIPFFWSPGWNSIQALNKFQQEVGGPLRGGNPGVRLLEPGQVGRVAATSAPPAMPGWFEPRQGQLLVVPIRHIFGSEELSSLSPPVAEVSVKPYLLINTSDASVLGIGDGGVIRLTLAGHALSLKVRVHAEMPRGVAGVPVGLRGQPVAALPAWGTLRKEEAP